VYAVSCLYVFCFSALFSVYCLHTKSILVVISSLLLCVLCAVGSVYIIFVVSLFYCVMFSLGVFRYNSLLVLRNCALNLFYSRVVLLLFVSICCIYAAEGLGVFCCWFCSDQRWLSGRVWLSFVFVVSVGSFFVSGSPSVCLCFLPSFWFLWSIKLLRVSFLLMRFNVPWSDSFLPPKGAAFLFSVLE